MWMNVRAWVAGLGGGCGSGLAAAENFDRQILIIVRIKFIHNNIWYLFTNEFRPIPFGYTRSFFGFSHFCCWQNSGLRASGKLNVLIYNTFLICGRGREMRTLGNDDVHIVIGVREVGNKEWMCSPYGCFVIAEPCSS